MTAKFSAKRRNRQSIESVLRYRPEQCNRSTVRRYHALWRQGQGIPLRCDTPACQFHTQPLEWAGAKLPLEPGQFQITGHAPTIVQTKLTG